MALFIRGAHSCRTAARRAACRSPISHGVSTSLRVPAVTPFSSSSRPVFLSPFAVFSANFSTLSTHGSSRAGMTGTLSLDSSASPSLLPLTRANVYRSSLEVFPTPLSFAFSTASAAKAETSPEIFKALKAGGPVLPAHLQHPLGGSMSESFTDKIYRWLDVTGVLTRWNNRKEWVLDLVPMNRLGSSTITEFERKQEMFVTLNAQILAVIAVYLAYVGIEHVNVKPPNPSYEGFPGVDGRKKDFTLTHRLFFMYPKERCKECRWLDLECKKECFARLKAEGYKLVMNGGEPLSRPRTKLEPPHFH